MIVYPKYVFCTFFVLSSILYQKVYYTILLLPDISSCSYLGDSSASICIVIGATEVDIYSKIR